MKSKIRLHFLLLLAPVQVHGFQQPWRSTRSLRAATSLAGDITECEWPPLLRELNAIPVFGVEDEAAGTLIEYDRVGKDGGEANMTIFFADVDRAQAELAQASSERPHLNLRLSAVGLGAAYLRVREGGTMITPGTAELRAARAPQSVNQFMPRSWRTTALPFFGCLQMTLPRDDGETRAVALFMSANDAAMTIQRAVQTLESGGGDGGGGGGTAMAAGPRKNVVLNIDRLVEIMRDNLKKDARDSGFVLVPPASTAEFMKEAQPATAPPQSSSPASSRLSGNQWTQW